MGFFGCSLYASTITAGILTLVDCVLLLTFDIFIVIFMTSYKTFNWSDQKLNKYVHGFGDLNTTTEVLIGLRIALRSCCLISTLFLFHGNAKEYRKFLYGWELLTVTRIVFAVGTSIYALVSFLEDLRKLFDSGTHWENEPGLTAKFTVFISFLDLGPIWLIVFIALIIFVHQRGLEIERRKRRPTQSNLWGPTNHNQTNGQPNHTSSQLAHPVSLTQEPNPLSVSKLERNHSSRHSASSSVEPVLKVDEVITIPRARVPTPPQDYNANKNARSSENKAYERKTSNASALAKRSSYLFNDSGRDPSKMPQRNHSYNYGQRPQNNAYYDNRAYQGSNNDLHRPVNIKRASVKK